MSSEAQEMSFWDHLEELRWVILRSLIAVVLLFSVLLFFRSFVFDVLVLGPISGNSLFSKVTGIPLDIKLINVDVAAQFFVHLRVTLLLSLVLVFPYLCYEIWKFLSPALYLKEKKAVRGAMLLGGGLFYLGVCTAYFVIVPLMMSFFYGYKVSDSVQNTFTLNSYISIFVPTLLMMGILFEFPSVIAVLNQFGVRSKDFLKKYRRHAIVIIVALAAVLTPTGDPVTLMVVSIPIYLLYELGVLIAKK